jgi:gliding motility-associated-like protein
MNNKKLRLITCFLFFLCGSLTAQPVADFTALVRSGCSPLSVQFSDLSSGNPTSFSWSFGNGNISTFQNPSAIYIVPGTYTVSLTVSNASGSDVEIKSAYITVFTSPFVDFSTTITGGCVPLSTPFSNNTIIGSALITVWLWDFGDGSIGSTPSPTHVYTTGGAKTVSLTATDANGCFSTVTKNALINPTQSHTADFTVSNPIVCKGPNNQTFIPAVNPPNTSYTYEWTTSNGLTSTAISPAFNFTNPGVYGVNLKVSAPSGCAAFANKSNAVYIVNTQVNFDLPNPPFCSGQQYLFKNQSLPDTSVATFKWTINNGNVTNDKDLASILNSGNQSVKLVTEIRGCKDSITKIININTKPVASFTKQPTSICFVPVDVAFNSTSIGSALSYNWNFGNGDSSLASIDTTRYTMLTSHNIKLVVTDTNGCSDSSEQLINVSSPQALVNGLNTKEGCKPYQTVFSISNPGVFTSLQWEFNGVTIGTASSFNYTFNNVGRHVVKLTAITAAGCRSEVFDTIWVGDTITFDFVADKFNGCYSQINPVTFTLTENSGVPDLTYSWYWKNGSVDEKNPVVNFTDTGLYNIRAKIVYNGCSSELEKIAYINILPALSRMLNPVVGCSRDTITFDATSSAGANRFLWLFGDGDTSNVSVSKHYYDTTGIYEVKLITLDTLTNCIDSAQLTLLVPDLPNINFTVSDTIGCSPLSITLSNITVLGTFAAAITNTDWAFTSGEITSGLSVTDTLYTYGWKGLTMTITDARGCVFSLFKDSVVQVSGANTRVVFDKYTGCTPLALTSYDSSLSDYPIIRRKWLWTSTDSTMTDTLKNASFVFTKPQNIQADGYQVSLIITDSLGCEFIATQKIVPSNPIAEIDVTKNLTCGSTQLINAANTDGSLVFSPAIYSWKQGSSTYNGSIYNTTFNLADSSYLFELTVVDSNGCTANVDTLIKISNKKSVLAFYANPRIRACYFPIVPIQLFDTSAVGSSGIKSRYWTFASNTSTQLSPIFTINKPGKYDVSLTVTDSAGCIDSLKIKDYLDLGGPMGSYTYSPNNGCTPHTVSFQVSSPNARYHIWDLGNGLVDTMKVLVESYTYNDAGTYYPKLTLYDSSGLCGYSFDAIDSIIVFDKPEPDFVSDTTKICFNTELTFENLTPNKPAIVNWKWIFNNEEVFGEGPIIKKFTKAGKYDITLIAIDSNGCSDTITKSDTLNVYNDDVAPNIPSVHRATVIDNSSNLFLFNPSKEEDFYSYRIFYNYLSTSPQSFIDVLAVTDTFYLETGINTLLNPYSYAISAIDICKNRSAVSPTHTTVELKASPIDNAIKLSWTPYKGFGSIKRYEIWRNNPDSGSAFYPIKDVSSGTLQYNDTSISCFTNYYYRIKTVAMDADTSKYSWSDTSGATPVYVNSLPGTKIVRVTVVNDKQVLLQWAKKSYEVSFKYLIFRMRDDESSATFYKEVSDTFMIDENVLVDEHSYSYFVYLKDACGGISLLSNEAKTILLTVDLARNDRGLYDPIIYYTKYREWVNGVNNYDVLFYYDSLGVYSKVSTNSAADTTFIHQYLTLSQRNYCYSVIANELNGNNATSQSNITCVGTEPRVYVPNVFTINGDAINDKLVVGGLFIESFNMKIFDRWGTLVSEGSDRNNAWDGNFDGKPMPSGVYVYLIEVTGRSKQRVEVTGTVTLIR